MMDHPVLERDFLCLCLSLSGMVSDSTSIHKAQLESSKKKLILFVCCSFLPIIILIVQNSFFFKDMIVTREDVLKKDKLVRDFRVQGLANMPFLGCGNLVF